VSTLADSLHRRIALAGPLTLADWMAECLGHPEHGYYITRDPLGSAGDFTTAPEISQMFGELFGAWIANAWMEAGSPASFILAEPGPGRGVLMADILRATRGVPGFHAAAKLHLIETSPALRAVQKDRLAAHDPVWLDSIADLPDGPLFLVANEFFDALPIRQFEHVATGWAERCVTSDGERFTYARRPAPEADFLIPPALWDSVPGTVVEICPAAQAIAREITRRLESFGGAALIADYGYRGPMAGDSFQAMKDHEYADPLLEPGEADLTAHVDFGALENVFTANGRLKAGFAAQGDFLRALGIEMRLAALTARADAAQAETLRSGCHRLIAEDEMGTLFKVLGIAASAAATLPGFR
jgi:SAM-dependent MidA family methyltransferase